MHELLENSFPYSLPEYDSRFLNRNVIDYIRQYCQSNSNIKAFYAKGSIIHGCMIEGSDVDQVRIWVGTELELPEKVSLVDELEERLQEMGVKELKRVREDGYIRVFSDWNNLVEIPNAHTKKYEIYPELRVITAKNNEDWFRKVIRAGYSYTGRAPEDWVQKMKERILNDI